MIYDSEISGGPKKYKYPIVLLSPMPEQITNDGDEDILQVSESAEADDTPELAEEDD
jgi:hypothetical protein